VRHPPCRDKERTLNATPSLAQDERDDCDFLTQEDTCTFLQWDTYSKTIYVQLAKFTTVVAFMLRLKLGKTQLQ